MTKGIISGVIVVAFILTVIAINKAGISARSYGKAYSLSSSYSPVYLARNTTDVYALWKDMNVGGRIVIHMGKFLHFISPDSPAGYKVSSRYPLTVERLPDSVIEQVTYRNFLWAAVQANIAREIYNVIPPKKFMERFHLNDEKKLLNDFITHVYASRRTMTTRLPKLEETVLLNIDASFFDPVNMTEFLSLLRNSGLSVDIITVCFAEDNPDVTEFERERLGEFIRQFSGNAEIIFHTVPPAASGAVR